MNFVKGEGTQHPSSHFGERCEDAPTIEIIVIGSNNCISNSKF